MPTTSDYDRHVEQVNSAAFRRGMRNGLIIALGIWLLLCVAGYSVFMAVR